MSVLKRPIITEKSQVLNASGKYAFEVALGSNKIQIAKAVEDMYGVTVTDVSTLRQFGKKKSRMTRSKITSGRTAHDGAARQLELRRDHYHLDDKSAGRR